MKQPGTGIFICNCSEEISSSVDTAALMDFARSMPDVGYVDCLTRACSPDGITAVQQSIRSQKLERVLVAACTPRLLGKHLQKGYKQAGISGDGFELVDIRESCAWIHRDKTAATLKAIDLLQMGYVRLSHRNSRPHAPFAVRPMALILGGGLAGMTAALTIAEEGLNSIIVERDRELGGALLSTYTILPDRRRAVELLAELREKISNNENILVLLNSRLRSLQGTVGNYSVEIEKNETASDCMRLDVGAIIVSTGSRATSHLHIDASNGLNSYTQSEFEYELKASRESEGRELHRSSAVMIPHLGLGPNPTLSRMDFSTSIAIKQAIDFLEMNPSARATIFLQDSPADHSSVPSGFFENDPSSRIHFFRISPQANLIFTDGKLKVVDEVHGEEISALYDLLVYASDHLPQDDASLLAHLLKIPLDSDGYFMQLKPALRPDRLMDNGIYICGSAHGLCSWKQAELQAVISGIRAARFIQSVQSSNSTPLAFIDEAKCTGCGTCVQACAFNAISIVETQGVLDRAYIDPLACRGCGNCLVVCPVKAISQERGGEAEFLGQIEAALSHPSPNGDPSILIFGCEWSAYAASAVAGARKLESPAGARLIRMECAARFDPLHALWAFMNGAEGIMIGACKKGECHYLNGNQQANERYLTLRRSLVNRRIDPRRLQFLCVSPDDPEKFSGQITEFSQLVGLLSPVDKQVLPE